MGTAAQWRGEVGLNQGTFRQGNMDQVIKAVVKQNLRVKNHDHVNADEHLEHAVMEIEIDWSRCLGCGAGPVKIGMFALAPDRQLHLEGAVATAIIVDVVLERLRFGR